MDTRWFDSMSVGVSVIFQRKARKIISRLMEFEEGLSDEYKEEIQDIIQMIREEFDLHD